MLFFSNIEARQRGRLAGFSLYVSNIDVSSTVDIKSSSLCYKDGSQLPPLNFTSTCTMFGRYVIYYNERRREVTYPEKYELDTVFTELCEVIINGKVFNHVSNINRYSDCFFSIYVLYDRKTRIRTLLLHKPKLKKIMPYFLLQILTECTVILDIYT